MQGHATVEGQAVKDNEPSSREIIVKGERKYKFAQHHWRQAVRQYLSCIWGNHFCDQGTVMMEVPTYVKNSPDACVRLRNCGFGGRYEAFGSHSERYPPSFKQVPRESIIYVSVGAPEKLEVALAHFAWNLQMRVLGIKFLYHHHIESLWLWGGPSLQVFEEPRDISHLGYL